ncbi:MAG TPA: class I SAM-dependent methyltransferase [Steroidobacteraceae bacterium]|nr:class I SAM-dependent methyltransferase [Steroidobacteraceae bacterium]
MQAQFNVPKLARMSQKNASRTALATAFMRATHQLLDTPPRVLEDPTAVTVLGPGAAQRIRANAGRAQTPAARALRAHMVLRSRFTEDRLAAAVARGVTQYVVLGAGFDTFAVRQPPWARGLRILEVDHAGTQELKRAHLAAAGLTVPPNVGFATLDFERESLRDGLLRHAISPTALTFFSWLGVTMYLPRPAIDAVLQSVAEFPAGSEIVLTFASASDTPRAIAERAAQAGEPWLSFFEPAQMQAVLHAAGFTSVELLTPEEAERRYFAPTSSLPAPRRTTIAAAVR